MGLQNVNLTSTSISKIEYVESAFLNYDQQIKNTFAKLPKNGRLNAVIERIYNLIMMPLLYPVLGISYVIAQYAKPHSITYQTNLINKQIAALMQARSTGWQQTAMKIIQKSRYDNVYQEMQRLKVRGILTSKVMAELSAAILKVDPYVQGAKRDQILVLMAQALEVKSIYKKTHHVFLHSQASNWLGLNYLVKELHKAFNPEVQSKHFKFLRAPCKLAELEPTSALWKSVRKVFCGEERISNVREYIQSKWFVNDDDGETREHLLSVDGYFYNAQGYESSLFFLVNNANIVAKPETIKSFYKQIIKYYNPKLQAKYLDQLAEKVFSAVQPKNALCGNLFTICVPQKISKDIQYRAHPYGSKCECHLEENEKKILSDLQDEKLNALTNCSGQFPIPQFRLYTPLLKPETTPIYLLTPHEKASRKKMKGEIKAVVAEIFNSTKMK